MPSKLTRLFLLISLSLMFFFWTGSLEAQTEVVIDNGDIRTSSTGTWGISGGADPYGPNSLWARDGATYTWTFTPTETGSFEVFMWWSGWASRSNSIPVDIQNQAGTDRVTINQQLLSGRWNSLGTFPFAAGVSYKVTIISQKYPTSTCADAVKFVNVIAPPNRPPVAINDAFSVYKNSADNALNVLGNDSDPDAGDTLTITAVGIPDHGGTVTINATNDGLIYSPASEYVGTETFTYTIKDPDDATAQATVTMTVNETAVTVIIDNGAPGTSYTGTWAISGGTNPYGPNSLWARDGATYSFSFSPPDTGDFDIFMWWSSWPSRSASIPVDIEHQGGTSRVVINQSQGGGQWNKLGMYAFQKGATYKVTLISQKYPTSTCADAVRFTSTGAPPNNPPVANDDSYAVNQNSSNNPLAVLSNDTDPDPGDTLTVSAVGTPNHGGSVAINATNDGLVYTPAPGFIGIENFTYTAQDSGEATDQATVTVTVNEVVVNHPPVANDDSYSVGQNTVNNSLAVLSNDSDPDSGDTITISAVGTPNHGGSVVINAPKTGLVYTPASGYSGTETFTYTIRDVAGATDSATVVVMVEALPVNNPPVANDDSYTVNQGSQNNVLPVLSNDSDPDSGDTITISAVGTPNHGGSVAINAPKTGLIYTPAAAFTGTETFSYTIRDVAGATDQATVSVSVQSGGVEIEDIYICYMYQHWWSSLEIALQDMGCQQINSDLWKFDNPGLNKQFMIHLVRDVQGTIDAMKIPEAFLIIAGHANYGLGPIPGTNAEKTTHIIPDIYTIDDPRIINISTPFLSVSISGLVGSQAYPNWQPIYQDGTDGRMPFGFNDPKGPPAYNYYITYQAPGDSTHYKIETSRYSALVRFPDAEFEPWYSASGAEPNPANPDQMKHFIVVPGFFQMIGTWLSGEAIPGFQGRDYNYLPAGAGTNVAQWDFRVLEAGNYRISAWWPAAPTNTTAARYTITHSSGSATVVRDQTVNGSQWNQLGEYYFTPGGYKVQLSDLSVAGDVIADALRVTAVNNIPAGDILNAEFYVRSRAGDAPFSARFGNLTIGEYTEFEWNFGDGTSDNVNASPTHIYENPGIYTVSLSVTGPAGTNIETKVGHVYVSQPPTLLAEFSPSDLEVNVPYQISFNSRSSGTPTNWSWTFGDGSSTTGWEDPRKTYTEPGLYSVSLTVTGGGQTSTETKQNLIRANLFDMTIDNNVPSYHYARKTCLFLREPDIRNDEMKFARLFYDSCNSGNYYLGRIARGIIMYSVASSYGWAHLPYLEGYMHGLSDEALWVIANDDDPNKLDYYNFNFAPSTLADFQAPISLSSVSPLRRVPSSNEALTPEREARIAGLQNLSFGDAWDKLRNVSFLANRTYFRTAVFTALGDKSAEAVAFALEKLKSSRRDYIGEDAGYRIPEWRLAMEVLRVFSQDALGRLFEMYEAGSPIDRRNVIHVLSGIPGEGMIKELLVGALSDQSPCQEEDETIEGIPLRVCDEAYNELVSRYDVKNTLRVIGTGHRLVDRDFHVAELRKLLGSDPEKGDRPDRQRKR